MSQMDSSCYEKVTFFFNQLSHSTKGRSDLGRCDQIIQFDLKDDESFQIEIKGGQVSLSKGIVQGLPLKGILLIKTDKETLSSLLEKKFTLGDAIYERKLWVYGNVLKGPSMAWLSKLLRLSV